MENYFSDGGSFHNLVLICLVGRIGSVSIFPMIAYSFIWLINIHFIVICCNVTLGKLVI